MTLAPPPPPASGHSGAAEMAAVRGAPVPTAVEPVLELLLGWLAEG